MSLKPFYLSHKKELLQWGRHLFVLLLTIAITYQLIQIGFDEILAALPSSVGFYLLFLPLFFSLPIVEMALYKPIWHLSYTSLFPAFLRKRVFNDEVLGYSGELYLFHWAKNQVPDRSPEELMRDVKDNNLVSVLSSYSIAIVLISWLILSGNLPLHIVMDSPFKLQFVLGLGIVILLMSGLILFKRYFTNLSTSALLRIYGLYCLRFSLHHGLLALQWFLAYPELAFSGWLNFVALLIVLNRIPFMPGKEVAFIWLSISIADLVAGSTAPIAGVLLTYGILMKIGNLIAYWLLKDAP